MTLIIAHLSDPHLDDDAGPLERLRQVIAHVREMPRVDALVVSGDIADHGLAREYQAFVAELPPELPTIVTIGNHDNRTVFEDVVGPRNSVLDIEGLRIVALDSSIPERDDGLLDGETLEFASAAIAAADRPVLIALHHPPVAIGHSPIDAYRLVNPDDLARLVSGSGVIGILTGHVHTPHVTSFADRPLIGAPGIASTLRIDDLTGVFVDSSAPAGFVVHRIENGSMASRFVALTPR